MMELAYKTVAFKNAPAGIGENGFHKLRERFSDISFKYESEKPDIIYFLTGGSEQEAIEVLKSGNFYLLLAGFEVNAYAAATEVKAWADKNKIATKLLLFSETNSSCWLQMYAKVCRARRELHGKRAGLIGNVSHWLVASHFPFSLAKERFGIIIEHLPWTNLPDHTTFGPDRGFLDIFSHHSRQNLDKEAAIYTFLRKVLGDYQLDALTIECFEMVNKDDVTACLVLALLNSQGIVAGCEGDLVSLVGMMLARELTGNIPWMANVASISAQSVLFAHCTAPLHLLESFRIQTHFETNKSTAIQGIIETKDVTVFRLSQDLDRAFLATGKIVDQPQHGFACRTQTEIALSDQDIYKLRHFPLGNHHLIMPGKQFELFKLACQIGQIEVL